MPNTCDRLSNDEDFSEYHISGEEIKEGRADKNQYDIDELRRMDRKRIKEVLHNFNH